MKIAILLLAISTTIVSYAGGIGSKARNDSSDLKRNQQVELTASIVENNAYINLKMKNESKGGVYSLVRYFEDGTYSSVAIKTAVPNTINQPILYSFVDLGISQKVRQYMLFRIGKETETVGSWSYNPMTGIIVATTTVDPHYGTVNSSSENNKLVQ